MAKVILAIIRSIQYRHDESILALLITSPVYCYRDHLFSEWLPHTPWPGLCSSSLENKLRIPRLFPDFEKEHSLCKAGPDIFIYSSCADDRHASCSLQAYRSPCAGAFVDDSVRDALFNAFAVLEEKANLRSQSACVTIVTKEWGKHGDEFDATFYTRDFGMRLGVHSLEVEIGLAEVKEVSESTRLIHE